MVAASEFPDAGDSPEDLSGAKIKAGDNPYDALINASHGSPVSGVLVQVEKSETREVGKMKGFWEVTPETALNGSWNLIWRGDDWKKTDVFVWYI